MDDIWPLVLRQLDLSTKVSARLTCKQFNSHLPRGKSVAIFYTYQCIKDNNFRLAKYWNQPTMREYYSAAIKANNIDAIIYLLSKQADYSYNWEHLCIKYDRPEIFKLMSKDFPVDNKFYYAGKAWLNLDNKGVNKIQALRTCIEYDNYQGFVQLLQGNRSIDKYVIEGICKYKRHEMIKACVSMIPNITLGDYVPAVFDDVSLLLYISDGRMCLEYSVMYKSVNVYNHLYQHFYGSIPTKLEFPWKPRIKFLHRAIDNYNLELLEMFLDTYPETYDEIKLYKLKFSYTGRKVSPTMEVVEFLYNNIPRVFENEDIFGDLFNRIDGVVLMNFLDSKGIDYSNKNFVYFIKSEEQCRLWIDKGNKLSKSELTVLFCYDFVVGEQFIEFLYDNSEDLDLTYSESFNPAVKQWLVKNNKWYL